MAPTAIKVQDLALDDQCQEHETATMLDVVFRTAVKYTAPSLAFAVVAVIGLLYTCQNSLIYPSNVPQGSRSEVPTPPEYGINSYEHLTLTTHDQVKIRAYLLKHIEGADLRPTLLFLHANAGNMGHRLPLAKVFYETFGYNVLMVSYRGYGLSEGTADEKGIRIDAQTALDYILSHPELEKTKIVLYGQSIGGAVAIDLAHRNKKQVHAVVVENTLLSLPELVPSVLPIAKPFLFLLHEKWDNASLVPTLDPLPILFLSGRGDTLIPPYHMDTLYAKCNSKKKSFISFTGAEHNDTCLQPGYFQAIQKFLIEHLPGKLYPMKNNQEIIIEDKLEEEGAEAGSRVPKKKKEEL